MMMDGEWNSPPPPWAIIQNQGSLSEKWLIVDVEDNLQRFIGMSDSEEGYGQVLQESEFLEFCQYSIEYT
jgi:N-terminal glutamine amidase